MAKWQNFSIWRGRLPHWRADDVRYYVTFRHRRDLNDNERWLLYQRLLRPQGRKVDYAILHVDIAKTEMIFTVQNGPDEEPYELSDIIEKAKRQAGNKIIKLSGERFPPFSQESFDRIIRDEPEFEETWNRILMESLEGLSEGGEAATLFVPNAD
jgi:hypothetical protein